MLKKASGHRSVANCLLICDGGNTRKFEKVVGCRGGSRYVEGFLVSCFLGFSVSLSLGFEVSRFLMFVGFLVSWFLGFCFVFKIVGFIGFEVSKSYQFSFLCSLEDIDPISKIFKNLFDGSAGFFGACLFKKYQKAGFPK